MLNGGSSILTYTVGHKNVPLNFHCNSNISWWFLKFYVPIEIEINTPQNTYKIYNFILSVSSIAAKVSAVRDSGLRLPAVCSIWLCATFAESRPIIVFTIFAKKFLDGSIGRKSLRFPHVLITFIIITQHIFISLHYYYYYYYARSNSTKWTLQCDFVTQL